MQAPPGSVDVGRPPVHGNQFPAGQHGSQPNVQREFSPQEKAIFAQCQSEAYWYRALPLSLTLGSATLYAVRSGLISASQKFGPWPKTILGATVGYIVGKASYITVCREKFLREAPDSELSRTIRKSQGQTVLEREADADIQGSQHTDLLQDGKDTLNTDGDTAYSDYFANPQGDKSVDRARPSGSLTYDQLRAEHRNKEMQKPYMQQGAMIRPSIPIDPGSASNVPAAPYSPQPPPPKSSSMYPPTNEESGSHLPPASKKTNKYGDEIFE